MTSRENGRLLEIDSTAADFNTVVGAASPTSSRGSWVIDPDEGWDCRDDDSGLESRPVLRSTEAPRQPQNRQVSPNSSPLRPWAQVPLSPPAAEYPTMMTNSSSPPSSPGSARSVNSGWSGSSGGSNSIGRAAAVAAGEGLVALARDENPDEPRRTSLMDTCDAAPSAVMVPRSLPFEAFEALEAQGFSGAWGAQGSADVGCDRAMDVDVSGFADPANEAFVMTAAPGMTAAEAVEAIAEAAELTGVTPQSVVLSRTTVSPSPPSRLSSGRPSPSEDGIEAEDIMFRRHGQSPAASYRSRAPLRSLLSSNTANANAAVAAATASGVGCVSDANSPMEAVSRSSSSGGSCIPMDATVGIGVDVDVDVDDGTYDRLWRWTGFLTAAKMGVIPIIVCATVAALSTQTSGGDRGDRSSGGGAGGGGGGGRGGGGGTRSSSRRRPRGGGGGGGCFPDARIDRSLYGGMPMPYCVAPSIACA